MKKGWLWFGATVMATAVVVATVQLPQPTVSVKTAVLKSQRVEQTIICSGTVEAGESTGVFAPLSCVISEVRVRSGQRVAKGDVLAVIDKEATRTLLEEDQAAQLMLAAMDEEITADADGIVVSVKTKAGEVLEDATPCAVVAPRSALQVRVSIREKDLRRLRTGMAVRVSGDGFGQATYDGTLTEIASTATASGNGAVVEGVVTLQDGQTDESLRLGLTAKAAVVTETVEAGLVVPYEAVLSDADGDYVYAVEDGCARRTRLQTKAQLKDGLLLTDLTMQGIEIVLQPEKILADGVAVNGEEGV